MCHERGDEHQQIIAYFDIQDTETYPNDLITNMGHENCCLRDLRNLGAVVMDFDADLNNSIYKRAQHEEANSAFSREKQFAHVSDVSLNGCLVGIDVASLNSWLAAPGEICGEYDLVVNSVGDDISEAWLAPALVETFPNFLELNIEYEVAQFRKQSKWRDWVGRTAGCFINMDILTDGFSDRGTPIDWGERIGNDIKNIVIPKLGEARETKKESLKALFLCRQGYNRSVTYALALDCCLFRASAEECWRRVSNIIICLRKNRPVMAYYLTDWVRDEEGSRKWVSCPHFRALRALHTIIHSAG